MSSMPSDGGCGCGGVGATADRRQSLSPPSLCPMSRPLISGESSMPSGGDGGAATASRRHSRGSDSPWMRTRCQDDDLADSTSKPHLLCACKIPVCQKRSNSARNPNRDYFSCSRVGTNAPYSCKTWIWVDLVRDYVEQMITFRLGKLRSLEEELAAVQKELELKSDALMCREIEMVGQDSRHLIETSELKSQNQAMEGQIKALNSYKGKFMKIRLLMLLYVAVCWLASGSLPMTLAASGIAAFMYLA